MVFIHLTFFEAADTYAAEPAAAEAAAAADDTAEYRAAADHTATAAAEAADRTEAAAVAAAEHTAAAVAAAEHTAAEAAADRAVVAADYSSEPGSCRSLPSQTPCPYPFFRILQLFFRVLQKRVRDPSLFLSRNPSYCLTLFSPLKFIIHLTYFYKISKNNNTLLFY